MTTAEPIATGLVSCGGVRITETSIDELAGKAVGASVRREDVLKLEIAHGRVGERPILTTLLALVILAFGALILWHIVMWFENGGAIIRIEGAGLSLIPLGAWMLWSTWRRGPLLFIETRRERRRFAFARGTTDQELLAFHAQAQTVLHGIPFGVRLER
jgi:hypothetical protein